MENTTSQNLSDCSLGVAFGQSIEAICYFDNKDVVEAAPTAMLQLHLSDQQCYN